MGRSPKCNCRCKGRCCCNCFEFFWPGAEFTSYHYENVLGVPDNPPLINAWMDELNSILRVSGTVILGKVTDGSVPSACDKYPNDPVSASCTWRGTIGLMFVQLSYAPNPSAPFSAFLEGGGSIGIGGINLPRVPTAGFRYGFGPLFCSGGTLAPLGANGNIPNGYDVRGAITWIGGTVSSPAVLTSIDCP